MLVEKIRLQIKKRMKNKDLNVHQLEKQAGLNRSSVQNILDGKSKNPTIGVLHGVARQLECSVNDLLVDGTEVFLKEQMFSVPDPFAAQRLFGNILDHAVNYIESHHIDLSFNQTIEFVKYAYAYCMMSPEKEVGENFVEWILKLYLQKCKLEGK